VAGLGRLGERAARLVDTLSPHSYSDTLNRLTYSSTDESGSFKRIRVSVAMKCTVKCNRLSVKSPGAAGLRPANSLAYASGYYFVGVSPEVALSK